MAGIRGRSGPPGNQNAFRHGLAGTAQRRGDGVLNPAEQSIREEILSGLLADKGGAAQISTAMRVLAEIIASLDGYKRPLVSSLSGNLQRFGMEKLTKVESLQEIITEITESTATNDRHSGDRSPAPLLAATDVERGSRPAD